MNREVYMPTKSSLPDPQNVADYPDNPKAVMVSARGVIRVVERLYYWDKEKHRGCEKRNYLGYVVGNQFYSNDDYHRLFNLSSLLNVSSTGTPFFSNPLIF